MKPKCLPYSLLLLFITTGCTTSPSNGDDVICQTYIHRYGVPLEPEDWSARGQQGQIMTTMKDGVVVTRTYDSGVLDGETTYTFPHRDTIQKRESYKQATLVEETWNYPNGTPRQQDVHHSPMERASLVWYQNGVPQCKEEYADTHRLMQGEYFHPSNQLESRVTDGNGVRVRRDGEGRLLSKDEIQDGQMVMRKTYHANEVALESIAPCVNGVPEGQKLTFLPGGEPNTIEEWRNGYQHGNTTVFQDGEKFADVPYQNGNKHGVERRYRNGDTLVEEVTWVQGQKHGPSYSYIGDTKKTSWYVQDKPTNKATYDAFENSKVGWIGS